MPQQWTMVDFVPSTLAVFKRVSFLSHGEQLTLYWLRKEEKPEDVSSSYRPFCLIDDIVKTLETLIVWRIEQHLKTIDGLSDRKFGFRKGKSTVDALQVLKGAMEKKEYYTMASLDITNAFNSIPFDRVLKTLRSLDLPSYTFCILRRITLHIVLWSIKPQ